MADVTDRPIEVITLLGNLDAFEVSLPKELAQAGDQLLRLPTLLPTATLPTLIGLTDHELAEAFREFMVGVSVERSRQVVDGGPDPVDRLRRALADELARGILAVADELLDQLRPRFDAVAQAVHEATELGLHPQIREADILRADNVVEMRDAYAALLGQAHTLGMIAQARIQLSRATGAPPVPSNRWTTQGPREAIVDVAGTMFRTDGRPWFVDREDGWQQWLRLSAGSPARLLTLDETVAAMRGRA